MFGGISRTLSIGSKSFLLMTRTSQIVTAADIATSTGGSTGLSSKQPDFVFETTSGPAYSYGRRLPGLRFRASRVTPLTPLLNLPAPGRRQTLYLLLRVGRVLCF
jgi:hypothetical protein